MHLPDGEILGRLSELDIPADTQTMRHLGGLGTVFTLEYQHGENFSAYQLSLDTEPLSPETTLSLLYDPLGGGTWGAEATSNAFRQMLNPNSMLYRRAADCYQVPKNARLAPHIDAIMDVLDSTAALAWRQATAAAYDASSVVNEVLEQLPKLPLRDFNRLWVSTGDLPTLDYKRIRRKSPYEQTKARAERLNGLTTSQLAALFNTVRDDLFFGFNATPEDTPPDTKLDRTGTVYIAKTDVPSDCTPDTVHETTIGPALSTRHRSTGPTENHPYVHHIRFRTTETMYAARPALAWVTAASRREFLSPQPTTINDPLGEKAIVTDHLLGAYIVASLCPPKFAEEHAARFKRGDQAVATLSHMALARSDELLGSTSLVLNLEELARQTTR